MRPHLIIDIGDRSIFSLMVDNAGNTSPCTQRILDSSLRYFFGEIFLDPKRYLGMNGNGGSDLFKMFEHKNYDIAHIREKIGWIWPYQSEIATAAISTKHPLKILSSLFLPGAGELMKRVLSSSYVLLEMMLEPIFNFVKSREFDLKEINVAVIIPGYFNRKSRLMLIKLLRKMNVHKCMIFHREIAAMMSCLNFPSIDNAVVLDMESEDVQGYRVNVNKFSNTITLNSTASFTLRDFGWNAVVKEFCNILYNRQLLNEHTGVYRSYIDKALMGLIYGIGSLQIPSSPSLKITHDLFDRIFLNADEKNPCNGFMTGLTDWIGKIVNKEDLFIPIGLPLMIGNFERQVLSAIKSQDLLQIKTQRSLERPAYGIADGLNWLQRNPDRKLRIYNQAGLRIGTRNGESIELVSHGQLPVKPGERCMVKKVLDFHMGEDIDEDVLHFNLLWGANPNSRYNANACVLFLEVKKDDFKTKRKIWITLDLQRAKSGGCLMGIVTIHFGDQHETGKFSIIDDAMKIDSRDIE